MYWGCAEQVIAHKPAQKALCGSRKHAVYRHVVCNRNIDGFVVIMFEKLGYLGIYGLNPLKKNDVIAGGVKVVITYTPAFGKIEERQAHCFTAVYFFDTLLQQLEINGAHRLKIGLVAPFGFGFGIQFRSIAEKVVY